MRTRLTPTPPAAARAAMSRRCLHVLSLTLALAAASPTPGRVPKVYNALITSNQNLEPSKAYPVYQPVLHDPFAFPYQPVFYSAPDYPNLFQSPRGLGIPQQPQPPQLQPQLPPQLPQPQPQPQAPGAASENIPQEQPPSASPPSSEAQPENSKEGELSQATPSPPLPPNTDSPIPLNQFGLPPQVLPLGRVDPAYNGYHQISPFSYTYPGFRFYDPFEQFALNPYSHLPPAPLYRPLTNSVGQSPQDKEAGPAPAPPAAAAVDQPSSPPPEPENLNLLNYASKDPTIPNVPPPPLPQGGLKTDSD